MNENDYTFEMWLEETELSFVRQENKDLASFKLAITLTNIKIFELKEKNKDDLSIKLIDLFKPLIMNFYVLKYYLGFTGENYCNKFDPINELDKLLGNKDLLTNYQKLRPFPSSDCGGC